MPTNIRSAKLFKPGSPGEKRLSKSNDRPRKIALGPIGIETRPFDLSGYTIKTLGRERRKTYATVAYLGLQSLNFVLLWMGVIPVWYAFTSNFHFTWRLTKLL